MELWCDTTALMTMVVAMMTGSASRAAMMRKRDIAIAATSGVVLQLDHGCGCC